MFTKAKTALAAVGTGLTVFTTGAIAALPPEVTAEVATAKADMLSALGLIIAAMVAVWGLRKLGQKLGWL